MAKSIPLILRPEYITQFSMIKDYYLLLKPRVMSLVVFSAAVGMFLAPSHIHPFLAIVAILCIAVGSGAAGAINMWYDRDIDTIMQRTRQRPIPSGRISANDALSFGVILAIIATLTMAVAINYLAALLLLVAILFYIFIYTVWLKRSTPQNIVIGGAAGAFPPMIGWAAVNNNITTESIILFIIIFFWTPPHFWALALYKSEDYQRANIPMLPVVKGYNETKKQILIYSIILLIVSFLPNIIKMSGLVYFIANLLLGWTFILLAYKVYVDKSNQLAPKLFGYSIFYLFALYSSLIIDKIFKFS